MMIVSDFKVRLNADMRTLDVYYSDILIAQVWSKAAVNRLAGVYWEHVEYDADAEILMRNNNDWF